MFNSLGTTWLSKRSVTAALGIAALLGITSAANAALIAYEGFDYANGSNITNQGGGYGWGPAWSSTTSGRDVTNKLYSLTYVNGGSLFVSGNHVRDGYADDNNNVNWPLAGGQTQNFQRQLINTQSMGAAVGGAGGSIWLSFLCQNFNTTIGSYVGYRETDLKIFRGSTTNANGTANVNGSEIFDVGVPNTWVTNDEYSIWSGSTYGQSGIATIRGQQYLGTDATLLVVRIDLDGTTANDTASLWVNPIVGPDGTDPGAPNVVLDGIVNLDGANGYRFQAGNVSGVNGSNGTWAVDEFRIGTTYWDVAPAPEPSTIALLGVALSGLWLTVRRKRA